VIIYDMPLPAGFQVGTANVAIEIAPGYPTSQLDMAYFYRKRGRGITLESRAA